MMKITGSNPRNRDPRYAYDKRVRLQSDDEGFEGEVRLTEGVVRDVSISGVAVSMDVALIENGQFINMHIEGLGQVAGNVAAALRGLNQLA